MWAGVSKNREERRSKFPGGSGILRICHKASEYLRARCSHPLEKRGEGGGTRTLYAKEELHQPTHQTSTLIDKCEKEIKQEDMRLRDLGNFSVP